MPLTDNLVGFWELEEAAGTTRLDALGTTSLTDHNTVGRGTGIVGNAAVFVSASSQYLTAPSSSTLQTGAIDFSLQVWVKFTSFPNTQMLIAKDDGSGAPEYEIIVSTAPAIVFRIFNGGFVDVTSSLTPSSGTWYHIIGYHDSVNHVQGIIINNGTPDTVSSTGGPTTNNFNFSLGVDDTSTGRFVNGTLDQVGLWKRVLSGSDITSLYNSGSGLSYAAMSGGGGGDLSAFPGEPQTGSSKIKGVAMNEGQLGIVEQLSAAMVEQAPDRDRGVQVHIARAVLADILSRLQVGDPTALTDLGNLLR